MANASASVSSTSSAEFAFGVPVLRPRATDREPAVRRSRDGHAGWLTERRFAAATILDLHGTLTGGHTSDLLRDTAHTAYAAGSRVLVVNLDDVTAIDAHGVQAVAAVARLAQQHGAELRIAGDRSRLADFALPPDATVTTFATADDALKDIRAALERRHAGGQATHWRHRWTGIWRRLTNREDPASE